MEKESAAVIGQNVCPNLANDAYTDVSAGGRHRVFLPTVFWHSLTPGNFHAYWLRNPKKKAGHNFFIYWMWRSGFRWHVIFANIFAKSKKFAKRVTSVNFFCYKKRYLCENGTLHELEKREVPWHCPFKAMLRIRIRMNPELLPGSGFRIRTGIIVPDPDPA